MFAATDRAYTCLVSAVTALFAPIALTTGQTPRPDSAAKPSILDTVVSTASRTTSSARTVAYQVISRDELRATGAPRLADVLQGTTAAAVVQSGSFGGQTSLYLRGGQSGYTRVLIDGIPVNDPGGDIDLSWLSLEDVDRIEVVRGPASVLYGSDAVTGVVQLFTGHSGAATHAIIGAGSFGSSDLRFSTTAGGPDQSLAVSLQRYDTRGIYAFNSAFRSTDLSATTSIASQSGNELAVTLRYSDDVLHIPTNGNGDVEDRNAFQSTRHLLAGVRSATTIWRATLQAAISTAESDGGFNDQPDGPADTLGYFGFQSNDHIVRHTADVSLAFPLVSSTTLIGVAFDHEAQNSLDATQSQFGSSTEQLDASRDTRAAFATASGTNLSSDWTLGWRVDDNSSFGRFVTYRAGLARQWSAFRVRGAVGSAFREPSFVENFAVGFARGNAHLRPETARSGEFGLDAEAVHGRIQLSATRFFQRFTDLIEYTFATSAADAPNFYNVAVATADGTELQIRFHANANLSIDATHTILATRVDNPGFDTSAIGFYRRGQQLLRRPAQSGSLSVRATLLGHVLSFARVSWLGRRDDIDYGSSRRVALPSTALIDANLRVPLSTGDRVRRLSALVRASNISNLRYEAVRGFRSPGRSILVGAEWGT